MPKKPICCPICSGELNLEQLKHLSRQYAGSCTSEKKLNAQKENAKKLGGRPKGCKNKGPRADKGVPRKRTSA